jgi:hypothetical protein
LIPKLAPEGKLVALDAQDFHAPIERTRTLASHVQKPAKARLAESI